MPGGRCESWIGGHGFSTIEVSVSDAQGAITLNRPDKLNPLSTITLTELVEAARFLDARREVKVIVLSGRGQAFCAGVDLAAFSTGDGSAPSADALARRLTPDASWQRPSSRCELSPW